MLGFRSQKPDLYDALFRGGGPALPSPEPKKLAPAPASTAAPAVPVVELSQLPDAKTRVAYHDGEKFTGGFGPTELLQVDYWTLRARSAQLFKKNLYARGIIRRMVTNEINSGLNLESLPEEQILGLAKGALDDWTEDVENRFGLWARTPRACDARERLTFGQIQGIARREALVVGDVLVTLQQDQRTGMPRVKLISGAAVQTPMGAKPRKGNRIVHGVELDPQGRQVAYWVRQTSEVARLEEQLTFKRLPAYGEKTGRRIAWLLYGTDKRLDEVRGEPLLSLVLQSLREIDRYRDALQRKAVVNSMLAMFIKKAEDKPGTRPLAGGAVRKGTEKTVDTTGEERNFRVQEHIPGAVIDELQTGEEPVAFRAQVADEKLGDFEEVIIQAVAWANEIPPEILRLTFSSNYSASQAAINIYKIYLHPTRTFFGQAFCQPIFEDWFLSSVLRQKVEARGFLGAWRDAAQYDTVAAWLLADWSGQIMPSLKFTDAVKAYGSLVEEGFITRDHAARELTGSKFSKNVKRLRLENEQLAFARAPLEALTQPQTSDEPTPPATEEDEDDEGNDDE